VLDEEQFAINGVTRLPESVITHLHVVCGVGPNRGRECMGEDLKGRGIRLPPVLRKQQGRKEQKADS
jgi:hypothetical protein